MKSKDPNSIMSLSVWLLSAVMVFLLFYSLGGSRVTANPQSDGKYYLLTGDAPNYLLLAHSIAFDGDIDLKNNRANKDYLAYYQKTVSGYTKSAVFWKKYVKGKLQDAPDEYWENRCYSVCPPGMPFLIAPAYRLGHEWGGRIRYCVSIFMMMLVTGVVLLTFDLVLRRSGSHIMASVIALAVALSGPLLFYTVEIYPDVPGAFFVLLAVWLFDRLDGASRKSEYVLLVMLGLVVGFLPWLHARFLPFSMIIGVFTLFRLFKIGDRPYLKMFSLGLACLSLVAPLMLYYVKLYGVPYPVSTHPPMSLKVGLTSGWIGLWLDRNNGILWYTPAAVFSIAGMWMMLKRGSLSDRMVVVMILGSWLLLGTFSDWRAGLCPPMRYWLPVFPLLAISVATCFSEVKHIAIRILGIMCGLVGCIVGVVAMQHPGRLFKYAHPAFPYWPWTRFYKIAPKFFPEAQWGDLWRGLSMLIAIVLMSVVLVRIADKNRHSEE
jgi:hypothetical protein